MKRIVLKATAVALASVLTSLLLAVTIVPAMGGVVDGNAWLMCILCPLFISWPASAYTFWQGDRLKAAHRELVRTHAQLAAAHRLLAEKASRDDMTGFLNRESFFAALEAARREPFRGSLLIIDADHFKSINDRFGHLAGDEALLHIAAAIRRGVREGDILGRIGGEEFGVFLTGAAASEAAGIAERIRAEVEKIRFLPEDGQVVALGVSIGGTICSPQAPLSELIRCADGCLYRAKARGRNRVVFGETLSKAA